MILTCPNCGTQYVVKDGAIPPQGRQVRCADCKHSWHQDPETLPRRRAPPGSRGRSTEAMVIEPRSGPEAEERAYEEAMIEPEPDEAGARGTAAALASSRRKERSLAAEERARDVSADFDMARTIETPSVADWNEPTVAEGANDEFSPFPAADEIEPRRRSPILIILILVLAVVALAVGFCFLAPPEWKARLGIGTGATSQLALVTTHMDRQQLASGNQLLTVTGRVINPTESEQAVPPLHAQIRTEVGRWCTAGSSTLQRELWLREQARASTARK